MNTHRHLEGQKQKAREPLFASPWMALFFGLRREFTQARARGKARQDKVVGFSVTDSSFRPRLSPDQACFVAAARDTSNSH